LRWSPEHLGVVFYKPPLDAAGSPAAHEDTQDVGLRTPESAPLDATPDRPRV